MLHTVTMFQSSELDSKYRADKFVPLSNWYHFWRYRVQISAPSLRIMTNVLEFLFQSVQTNIGVVHELGDNHFNSYSF